MTKDLGGAGGFGERFRKGRAVGYEAHEVLELLISCARAKKQDPSSVASNLMKRFRNLRGVLDAGRDELKSAGLSDTAATMIKAVKEAAGVYLKERMLGRDVIRNQREALDYLNLTLSGERVEKFLAIYLNKRNEAVAVETLHEGTINQTVVYPRKAIELAFRHGASAMIFVHNHPSGDATPSGVDRQLAKALDRAALAVDLIVHDHLIIGKNRHFSARENGWIIGLPLINGNRGGNGRERAGGSAGD